MNRKQRADWYPLLENMREHSRKLTDENRQLRLAVHQFAPPEALEHPPVRYLVELRKPNPRERWIGSVTSSDGSQHFTVFVGGQHLEVVPVIVAEYPIPGDNR